MLALLLLQRTQPLLQNGFLMQQLLQSLLLRCGGLLGLNVPEVRTQPLHLLHRSNQRLLLCGLLLLPRGAAKHGRAKPWWLPRNVIVFSLRWRAGLPFVWPPTLPHLNI